MIRKRTKADGNDSYQVIIRTKGYPDFVKTYRTKREAEREEIKIKAAMQNGTYHDSKSAEAHTLSDAIDRFLSESFTQERKNLKTEQGHLLWWKEQLGQYALIRITPELIAKRRDALLLGHTFKGTPRSPSTVNRYMATLSTLLTIVVEEWLASCIADEARQEAERAAGSHPFS